MKKTSLLIVVLVALISGITYKYIGQNTVEETATKKRTVQEKFAEKQARIDGYLKWRNEMTANDFTGEVNPADHVAAVEQINARSTARSSAGQVGLKWVNRGPNSQGGRTRAVLFDRKTPNLVYTGGISGGMFKSEDLGRNWTRIESYGSNNPSIMSLAQTISGTIYVGTGESLAGGDPDGEPYNAAFTGNGIYKSSDNGETWTHVTSTQVDTIPNFTGSWASVNAMAAHPTITGLLLAGTVGGLYVTTDAEAADPVFTAVTGISGGRVSDVKITDDGQIAFMAMDGGVYKSTAVSDNFASGWSLVPAITGPSGRVQLAVSTQDSNGDFIIYASSTRSLVNLASYGCLNGVFRSLDKGDTWEQIIYSGGVDPFAQPTGSQTSGCQGWYDHCIAVNPKDKNKIYIGGISFYTWAPTSGGLKRADQIGSERATNFTPEYIHADKHIIVFNPHDTTGNTMIIGNDGGMVLCANANSGFPDNMTYTQLNKNYVTLQAYSVGSGKYGEAIAGSQDNGTQYIDGYGISFNAATNQPSGGDGVAGAEISNLSPGILFSGVYYGRLYRSLDNGENSGSFLDDNINPAGCRFITCGPLSGSQTCDNLDGGTGQSFIYPFYLMETYNRKTPKEDALIFAANDTIVLPGGGTRIVRDTITELEMDKVQFTKIPKIDLKNLNFSLSLANTLYPGDTQRFTTPFDAKYFIPTRCSNKLFVCTNPLQNGTAPVFTPVTVINDVGGIKRMDASADGDLLAAVTVVKERNPITRELEFRRSSVEISQGWDDFTPTNTGVITNVSVNLASLGGKILAGVSVNKNNKDHILVTEAGYGSPEKVFVSFNATSANPTFTDITNNLPSMPVYACLIDKANPDRYILATEYGMWASNDAGATWHEENEGMGGRFPTYSVRQKWMNKTECDLIVAGTFGAGIYYTTSLMNCADKDNLVWKRPKATSITQINENISTVLVYPNPVKDVANISFALDKAADINVRVIDLSGKIVSSTSYEGLSKGEQLINYDASDLSFGTYFVVLSSSEGQKYNSTMFIKK